MNIGTVWRRRELQDDPWDEVVVRGWFGGEGELREIVVAPVTFGETISCPPEALQEAYRPVSREREEVEASIEAFGDRLEDLVAAQNV